MYYCKEKKEIEEDDDDDDEDEDSEGNDKYLLLKVEIPVYVVRLIAGKTYPKFENFKEILIKQLQKIQYFNEQPKEDFSIISDNRSYDEFSYFIVLKRYVELSKIGTKSNTEFYEIQFDKRNKEKFLQKEKDGIINKANLKKIKIKKKVKKIKLIIL